MKKKWEKILGWTFVALVFICYVLIKLGPVFRKGMGLDMDGRIFVAVLTPIFLCIYSASIIIEHKRMKDRAEKLNNSIDPVNSDISEKADRYIDKKHGSSMLADLSFRYKRKAALAIFVTALLAFACFIYLFVNFDISHALMFGGGFVFSIIYTAFKLRHNPVKKLSQAYMSDNFISINDDYMNGRLISLKGSGINVGKLFAVYFDPDNILIIPVDSIENVSRCIVYKSANKRGLLDSEKLEYRLNIKLSLKTQINAGLHKDELNLHLDKHRLEIAFDALKSINVPFSYEYTYVEEK